MQKIKNTFSHLFFREHLFLGYFLTYFIVMFVPFLLGVIYYHKATDIIYEDTININSSILHHTASITDIPFDEITSFAEQLVIHPDVTTFQSAENPFEYPNTYQMIQLCQMLSTNYSHNEMIENFFLFFHYNESCITGKYAYPYQKFYDIYYKETGLSYEEWLSDLKELVCNASYLSVNLPVSGQKKKCLAYGRPLLSIDQSDGFLLVVLKENLLTDLFSAIDISDGGALYIQDKDGKILYSDSTSTIPIPELQEQISLNLPSDVVINKPHSNKLTIDGQQMLVTSTTTSANQFTYVFVQRLQSITERADSIKLMMIAILILSFIVGSILCCLMSRNSSLPLDTILKTLPPTQTEEKEKTVFDRITSSWSELVSQNHTIEEMISRQIPFLQHTFLTRLLKSDFSSLQETQNLADCIHFDYHNKNYTVLVFRLFPYALPSQGMNLSYYLACRMAVTEKINQYRPDFLCTEHDTDQIVCLSVSEPQTAEQQTEEIRSLIRNLKESLPRELYNHLHVSVGSTVSSLTEIVSSYGICQTMLSSENFDSENLPIQWNTSEKMAPASYFYPYEAKANLIRFVLSGEIQSLREALHNLFSQNIMERSLPPFLYQMFLNELISTLFSILTRMSLPSDTYQELYRELEGITHQDDLQKTHYICTMFDRLCSLAASLAETTESNFVDSVTSYIRKNFVSPELSLTGVADAFHVNESYLSFAFKKHTRTNFSIYLEKLRMDFSRELLLSTDRTIADIASASGYYSSNSFCRAFKRFWGYTPTQCRNGENHDS